MVRISQKGVKMDKDGRKKVGFDLHEKELETVRNICKRKKIKLVDFFRDAVNAKIDKENKYMTIYVIHNMTIKELTIRTELYDILLDNASDEMKKNVSAEQEGKIALKEDFEKIIEGYNNENDDGQIEPIIFFDDTSLIQMLQISGETQLPFFTKERY